MILAITIILIGLFIMTFGIITAFIYFKNRLLEHEKRISQLEKWIL